MLILFAIKMCSVGFYSSRNISLGFPYDSLTFDGFERFTDWLITADIATRSNPYDPSQVGFAPSPYGYLTYLVMRALSGLGIYLAFGVCLLAFIWLCFIIFRHSACGPIAPALTAYLAFLVGFYPLYFEVDRGNIEIFASIALACIFICIQRQYARSCIFVLLAVIASLKPSCLLFALPIVFFAQYKDMLLAGALIAGNYLAPMFLPNGHPAYLLEAIRHVNGVLGPQKAFCHNLACGLRAAGVDMPVAGAAVLVVVPLIWLLAQLRFHSRRSVGLPMSIVAVTAASLLSADPSADYALTLLLPCFLYLLGLPIAVIDNARRFRSTGSYLVLGFVLACGFTNVYLTGRFESTNFNYITLARTLGLLLIYAACFQYAGAHANVRWPRESSALAGEGRATAKV